MSEIMITLSKIAAHRPCEDGWYSILKLRRYEPVHWSEFKGDDTEFPLVDALESNGPANILWALRCLPEHGNLWRKYAVWCAAQFRHSMTDTGSLDALRVAWLHSEVLVSDAELEAAAKAASWAAWAASWADRAAAWAAASAAAWADRAAAWAAARDTQEQKLREILTAGKWVGECPVQDLIDAKEAGDE